MNRSGIKRGLAVSAVAALGVVGIPGMAHAAASTDAYTITVSENPASVNPGQDSTVTITAKTSAGANATGDITVDLSEAVPSGTTDSSGTSPIKVDDAATTDTTPTNKTWDAETTVSLVNGTGSFKLSSSQNGSVAIKATGNNAAGNGALTVGGGLEGNDAVKTLQFSTTSVTGYTSDTNKVKVTPVDANGYAVSNVTISNSVDNGTHAALTGTPDSDGYSTDFTLPSDAGNHNVLFWVNQTTGSNTPAADSSEPQGTVTDTVTAAPVNPVTDAYATNITTPTVTKIGSSYYIPADNTDYSLPTSVTVKDQNATPGDTSDDTVVPGAHVRFDVVIHPAGGGADIPMSLPAVADDNGVASISPTLPAGLDVNGTSIDVTPYLSETSTGGQALAATRTIQVVNRAYSIKPAAGSFQASKGGTVNVPVTIADQFGDAPKVTQSLGFTITSGPNANPGAQTVVQATDGKATFTYTDTKATVPGAPDTVQVNDLSTTGVSANETVNFIAGSTTASKLTLSSDPTATYTSASDVPQQTVSADAAPGNYTVHVENANGEALTNSPVTFSVNNGFVVDPSDTTNKGASITVRTDGSGDATVQLGSTTAGSQALNITAGDATVSPKYPVTYKAAAPYSLSWSSAPATIVPGQSAKYLAEITDEWGNPVQGAYVGAQMADNTQPGTVDAFDSNFQSDANGIVSVVVKTLETDSGTGTLTVTPAWTPTGPAPASDGATATYTDAKGIDATYSVEQSVTPPPPPAKKPQPKIWNFWGKSKGNRDILTVRASHANGKRMNLTRGGKVIAHGAVRGGKIVFRVKDINGNKKAVRYVAKVAHSRKATRVF